MLNEYSKISDWVNQDFSNTKVFDKLGIDFCCGGQQSLKDAIAAKNLNQEDVLQMLQHPSSTQAVYSPTQMSYRDLVDYIESEFHAYIRQAIPAIQFNLQKVIKAHSDNHPELFRIKEIVDESFDDLLLHLMKEEKVLFPLIRNIESSLQPQSVLMPIRMMEIEHDTEGDRYKEISDITQQYTPPADACNTYKYLYTLLSEFETNLHEHIHIENNILFDRIKQQFQN